MLDRFGPALYMGDAHADDPPCRPPLTDEVRPRLARSSLERGSHKMTPLVALALSIGALGGIATAIYLKTGMAIWAGFIAWACFFHSGGDGEALKKTILGNLFGIFCAAVAAVLLLGSVGASLGGAAAPVIVGVTVFGMVMGAHLKPFSTIPASVYGYAATFAAILMAAQAVVVGDLMVVGITGNPVLRVAISMIVGALFGIASAKLAGALTKKA